MWVGEAADRRRIGEPPGAPREPGWPAMGRAGCQGSRGAGAQHGEGEGAQNHQVTRRAQLPGDGCGARTGAARSRMATSA